MSEFGTFETCRPVLSMSVHRRRPEVTDVRAEVTLMTHQRDWSNARTTSGRFHRQSDEGQHHEGRQDRDVEGKTE